MGLSERSRTTGLGIVCFLSLKVIQSSILALPSVYRSYLGTDFCFISGAQKVRPLTVKQVDSVNLNVNAPIKHTSC